MGLIPNFNTYQPPGVYVEGSASSVVAPTGTPETTVTIIGVSRGYQLATETIQISATAQELANTGVLTSPALTVTTLAGVVAVVDTDYTVVYGATSSAPTTIALVGTSTLLASGDQVVVSYTYADATYYQPKTFEDYPSVEVVYGAALISTAPASSTTSHVLSPLSLAARIAFENGARNVICLALEPPAGAVTFRDRFVEAYTKISTNPEVGLLVPLFTPESGQTNANYTTALSNLIGDVRAHCVSAAADGFGRIAFVGLDTSYDEATSTPQVLAAAADSARVCLAYPYRMKYYNNNLSITTEVGGLYLAAAYAGRLSIQEPARGLTKLPVFSFVGIPEDLITEMTTSVKDALATAGVAVTELSRTSQLLIRHGVSTDMTNIATQELSLTRSYDLLYRQVADGIESSDLVGQPIDDDMTIRIKGILTGILESAQTGRVIRQWLDLQVRQQSSPSGNPTVIECQFVYRPFLPLNYIVVTFQMDLTTGDTTITDQTVA